MVPSSEPIKKNLPYSRQSINQDDIDAVVQVLRSDYLTQGPEIIQFEEALKSCTGASFCTVCSSGTAALHLAMLALGVTTGDRVWTVPNTFVATANAALYCGAEVDFVDMSLDTFNMDLDLLAIKLESACLNGGLPKVIVPVHFAGNPVDMACLAKLKEKYGFYIIEDACHALGSFYRGDPIGSSRYSEITVFSFHPVKAIACGEGGALLTNSQSLDDKVKMLRHHGVVRDIDKFEYSADGPWSYEQQALGFNYRLSSIHAALGLSQLKRLALFVEKRCYIAAIYKERLSDLKLGFQRVDASDMSATHLSVILLKNEQVRAALFAYLVEKNIIPQVHYKPVHLQPFYMKKLRGGMDLPVSVNYYKRCLSLPTFYDMTDGNIEFVIGTIRDFFTRQ